MTDAEIREIREIRERCEAAVNGPWHVKMHNEDYGQGYGETTYYVEQGDELLKIGIGDRSDKAKKYWANAAFIAHARQDVPTMLAELERLRAELEAAKRDVYAAASERHVLAIKCRYCKGETYQEVDKCVLCNNGDLWEWRGPVADNAPAPEMGAPVDEAMGG